MNNILNSTCGCGTYKKKGRRNESTAPRTDGPGPRQSEEARLEDALAKPKGPYQKN